MNRTLKSSAVLSACQLQAVRLNQLESRRLQRNVNLMHDDLQEHLARLERDAQYLKYHYTHVVRFVKPNRAYQLWKEAHAYEIAQDEKRNRRELIKLKQRAESRTRTKLPPIPCKTVRPLALLLDDNTEKTVEPLVDRTQYLLRPTTSPLKTQIPRTNSTKSILLQRPDSSRVSHLPPIAPSHSRGKSPIKPKTSNQDVLYEIALHDRKKSTRPDKRRASEKDFTNSCSCEIDVC